MKFQYWRSRSNRQWYFRIVARNGKTVAQSEGYKRKKDCKATMTELFLRIESTQHLIEPEQAPIKVTVDRKGGTNWKAVALGLRAAIGDPSQCGRCKGKGWLLDTTYDRTGEPAQCNHCEGTGKALAIHHTHLLEALAAIPKTKPEETK